LYDPNFTCSVYDFLHSINDMKCIGSLDLISAFLDGSNMKIFRKYERKSGLPFQQLLNRIAENNLRKTNNKRVVESSVKLWKDADMQKGCVHIAPYSAIEITVKIRKHLTTTAMREWTARPPDGILRPTMIILIEGRIWRKEWNLSKR
jgi:hypothetical protein